MIFFIIDCRKNFICSDPFDILSSGTLGYVLVALPEEGGEEGHSLKFFVKKIRKQKSEDKFKLELLSNLFSLSGWFQSLKETVDRIIDSFKPLLREISDSFLLTIVDQI